MAELEGLQWYAVQSQPNAELRAAEHLDRQGFACYVPTYLKQRRHARRVETVKAPFFPRYLFVRLDVARQRWRAVNSTVGVTRLVGRGLLPTPVMPGVVDEIRRREGPDGMLRVAPAAARFSPGDAIRVTDGVFEACQGLFLALTDKDRVAILLDLLGRKVRVVLDAGTVEAA
ncbi:MAG: transcriptional activator RfaH [Alsobacter sp.]